MPASLPLPSTVPIFPLGNHVLLPGLPMPYRLFEPRYLALGQMLLGLPTQARWLCIPCLTGNWQASYHEAPAGAPKIVHRIG